MNKKQFVESLDKYPDDIEILLAADSEGNTYALLEGSSIEYVDKDYNGSPTDEVFNGEDLAEDAEDGQIPSNFKEVLVFWPV
jgi:hypothetical protein